MRLHQNENPACHRLPTGRERYAHRDTGPRPRAASSFALTHEHPVQKRVKGLHRHFSKADHRQLVSPGQDAQHHLPPGKTKPGSRKMPLHTD